MDPQVPIRLNQSYSKEFVEMISNLSEPGNNVTPELSVTCSDNSCMSGTALSMNYLSPRAQADTKNVQQVTQEDVTQTNTTITAVPTNNPAVSASDNSPPQQVEDTTLPATSDVSDNSPYMNLCNVEFNIRIFKLFLFLSGLVAKLPSHKQELSPDQFGTVLTRNIQSSFALLAEHERRSSAHPDDNHLSLDAGKVIANALKMIESFVEQLIKENDQLLSDVEADLADKMMKENEEKMKQLMTNEGLLHELQEGTARADNGTGGRSTVEAKDDTLSIDLDQLPTNYGAEQSNTLTAPQGQSKNHKSDNKTSGVTTPSKNRADNNIRFSGEQHHPLHRPLFPSITPSPPSDKKKSVTLPPPIETSINNMTVSDIFGVDRMKNMQRFAPKLHSFLLAKALPVTDTSEDEIEEPRASKRHKVGSTAFLLKQAYAVASEAASKN